MRVLRATSNLKDQGAAKLPAARKGCPREKDPFIRLGSRAVIQGDPKAKDHHLAHLSLWFSLMSSYHQRGQKKVPVKDLGCTFQKGPKKLKVLDQVVSNPRI